MKDPGGGWKTNYWSEIPKAEISLTHFGFGVCSSSSNSSSSSSSSGGSGSGSGSSSGGGELQLIRIFSSCQQGMQYS